MLSKQIITIVGGGTAGWMSACLMAKKLDWSRFVIQVVESPDIQTVGVGEGSTPFLKDFFDSLDIKEHDWMPACQATYKCGIRFPGWTQTVDHQESYIHPFYNELDNEGARQFFRHLQDDDAVHPDHFFVSSQLALKHQSPIHIRSHLKNAEYGYHFDAGLLGHYLRSVAKTLGVMHRQDTIERVNIAPEGHIESLETLYSGNISGDIFVDCTGFKGLLIREGLHRPYLSLKHRLFNDSAIAVVTPHDKSQEHLPSYTDSIAMRHGWMWRIPLQSRMGNGYVFSSAYSSFEQVEQEMRSALRLTDAEVTFKHLRWEPGRLHEHWYQNCVAIGLSQGFLEPLEAPALNIMQHCIEMLVATLQKNIVSDAEKREYNLSVNGLIDGTVDYIQAHYLMNSRSDSEYWHAARNNKHRSAALQAILSAWQQHHDIDDALRKFAHTQPYFKTSWLCLLAGMDRFQEGQTDSSLSLPTSDYFYHDEALTLLLDHAQGIAQHKGFNYA